MNKDLISRLHWLGEFYLRDEDLVFNDKAFSLCGEIKKAAKALEQADKRIELLLEAANDIHETLEHETAHVTGLQTWALGDAIAVVKENE